MTQDYFQIRASPEIFEVIAINNMHIFLGAHRSQRATTLSFLLHTTGTSSQTYFKKKLVFTIKGSSAFDILK